MTREEHLKKIVERCEKLIEANSKFYRVESEIAGWKSTIAAIEGFRSIGWDESDGEIHSDNSHNGRRAAKALDSIISAWPEELL